MKIEKNTIVTIEMTLGDAQKIKRFLVEHREKYPTDDYKIGSINELINVLKTVLLTNE